MRYITYGLGGYDPDALDGNVVEDYDDGEPAPADAFQVSINPDALSAAQAAVADATTMSELRTATLAALDLLNPGT